MTYTHHGLIVNNRNVLLENILQEKEIPNSDNEASAFNFLRAWLNGERQFQLQTSGSTGIPKKISVTREQLIASASATIQALRLTPGNTALICLNTTFIAGIMMLVRSLVQNLSIILVDPTANPLDGLVHKEDIDFAALVPYQADTIMQQQGHEGIGRIKKMLIGGAPLSYSLKESLGQNHSEVYLTYGMTETLSHIALQRISGNEPDGYFTTMPGVSISQDARGCLVIEVPYLAQPVITNDLVDILSPSTFKWLGRWDNVINSGGLKIVPEEVEGAIEKLLQQFKISSFFVSGTPDEKLGSKLTLFIESTTPIDTKVVLEKIRDHGVSAYHLPRQVIVVPRFERTLTGKVKRTETVLVHSF
jgi:O-succinylbenzoic acid--CoA ligase